MTWVVDVRKEFDNRTQFMQELRTSPHAREICRKFYAANPIQFIEDWCITYDPRVEVKYLPFKLFPKQKDFINFLEGCLKDREGGLVEKSRDMGITWACAAYSAWRFLFHPGTAIGFGSRNGDMVDNLGNPSSIFEKIRMIFRFMPEFWLPEGFKLKKHATEMRIINPQNGATIIGECGDEIGRGGRTTMYFKDESAHYERPERIEAALGDNTDVQIDVSSVNGTGNVFHRRRMAGELWEPGKVMSKGFTRVFIFDWRDNPLKSQEWYDNRRAKAEREGLLHIFAQEVDRDYAGSKERIIIRAEWVKAAIDAHIKLGFDGSGEKVAAADIADGGADKNALVYRNGVILRYADHWPGEAGDMAEKAVPVCAEAGIEEIFYDSIGVGVGFKTKTNTMKEWPTWPQRLRVFPWDAGAAPLNPEDHTIPDDLESPLNKDQYMNVKAQGWFALRARFWKTFCAVTRGDKFDPSELISLSSADLGSKLSQIEMELSQPVHKYSSDGKTLVDKAPNGTPSPNLADAIMMCYHPIREYTIFDAM